MKKIIYWIATGIMCLIFGFSIFNYFFNHEMVSGFFVALGFPTWLIYPMAIAKILGIVAVLTQISPFLKEWAYAGLFFNSVLALAAHLQVSDGQWPGAAIALTAVIVSRIFLPKAARITGKY